MVAQDVGITYNGLATRCTPVSRLAADPAGCPTTAFIDCNQVGPLTLYMNHDPSIAELWAVPLCSIFPVCFQHNSDTLLMTWTHSPS